MTYKKYYLASDYPVATTQKDFYEAVNENYSNVPISEVVKEAELMYERYINNMKELGKVKEVVIYEEMERQIILETQNKSDFIMWLNNGC
jgi:hypothetical protein